MTSAKLIIRSPGKHDKEVQLTGGVSIGRAFDNPIRVDVEGVSRYHAIIEQKADGFWLSDLGSRNGTAVNGVAVAAERKLEDGNMILLGGVSALEFRANAAPAKPDASEQSQKGKANEGSGQKTGGWTSGGTALRMGLAIAGVVVVVFIVARLVLPTASGTGGRSQREGSVMPHQA